MAMESGTDNRSEYARAQDKAWGASAVLSGMVGAWAYWTEESDVPADQAVKARLWDQYIEAALAWEREHAAASS